MFRTLVSVLSFALLVSTAGLAQPGHGPGRRMDRPGKQLAEGLNLTEQQQKQMQDLQISSQKKRIQHRAKIQTAHLELRQLLTADKPDRSAIEKKMKEISDLEYQGKLNRVDHMFAVQGMLTAEQKEVWKKQMIDKTPHMRSRMNCMMSDQWGDHCPRCGNRPGPWSEEAPEPNHEEE